MQPLSFAPARGWQRLSTGAFVATGKKFFSLPPFLFARAILSNPRAVGAACPSSHKLAKAIAEQVKLPCDGLIVELGAGTGAVTAALLRRGVLPSQLVVVEKDKRMARHLKNRFKGVVVIHGNAVNFCKLCNRYNRKVATVVSSLPLLSLPSATVAALGKELRVMLKDHGTLIQYTYQITHRPSPLTPFMQHASSTRVWANFPPARVELYKARLPNLTINIHENII
ncbi:MAG: methyltransferase type 12 [Proteobacteria bacterium]|nr:methyltransferase type 12 [Pseudomonadota bacterium]